ncbi:MAG: TatD family hydrolase [Candidatus Diapherotrites archaeon]
MLIDSHCHLQEMKEQEKEIQEAKSKGITKILTNSVDMKSIEECLELAKRYKEVKAAIGIHPINILGMSQEEIKEALQKVDEKAKEAIAIGEIGLDYKYAKTQKQKQIQEESFREQIRIGIKQNKTLVIHSREAEKECLKILEEEKAKKVQMHWFTNNEQNIQIATELDYYMSCGPIICYDEKAQQIAKKIPIEKMLLETDAPVIFKGQQSSPTWITKVCEKVSEIKEISFEKVAKTTTKNFNNLFE